VVPVGAVKLTWGGNAAGSTDWLDAKLKELDAEQPTRFSYDQAVDVDAIAKLNPDVIIAANSGITKQDYAKLTKIAPTVAPPGAIWVTSWQDSLDISGQVLGRNKLADQVEADTEEAIEEAKAANPDIQGKSLIFSYLSAADLSQVGVYLAEDNRVRILTELGMVSAPVVKKLEGSDPYYAQISAERSSELQSDVLLTYVEKPTDLETFKEDKLVGQIPALKSGNVYGEVDKHVGLAITNPSPLSIPYLIEHFLPNVVKAATAG
jgi:iron complex transport system substrate-binding protein